MAIERSSVKVVARSDSELFPPNNSDMCMPSDNRNVQKNSISAVESDDDDEFDECDSGAGSDDFNMLELGESSGEFCQVGDQTCSIPYDLYALQGLDEVLSMDVWNEVLTEEERFELSKYLPDMDQENFVHTLKELFSGTNLDFGNPVDELFKMLKGGLCEPRLALYRQGTSFVQRRQHYHNLRKYQNTMVTNLCQIRDAWVNCKGYSIEEKLRVLNIMKSQNSLLNENMEVDGSEPSEREESTDGLWVKKTKERKVGKKTGRYTGYGTVMASDMSYYGKKTSAETAKYGKQKPKGTLKLGGLKTSSSNDLLEPFHTPSHGVQMISGLPEYGVSHYNEALGHGSSAAVRTNKQVLEEDDENETIYDVAVHRVQANDNIGGFKSKKHGVLRGKTTADNLMSMTSGAHAFDRKKEIERLSDTDIAAKPANARHMHDGGKKHVKVGKGKKSSFSLKEDRNDLLDGNNPALFRKHGGLLPTYSSYVPSEAHFEANPLEGKFQSSAPNYKRRAALGKRDISSFSRSEETESDSSEQADGVDDDNPIMRSKWAYPSGVLDLKYESSKKTVAHSKRDKSVGYLSIDGSPQSYIRNPESMRSGQKGAMYDVGNSSILPTHDFSRSYFPGAENSLGDGVDQGQVFFPLGSNGHVERNHGGSLRVPSGTGIRKQKGEVFGDVGHLQHNRLPEYNLEDDLYWTRTRASEYGVPSKTGKKDQMFDLSAGYHHERQDMQLLGCSASSKKRKIRDDLPEDHDYLQSDGKLHLDHISSSKKRGKIKGDNASVVKEKVVPEPTIMEMDEEEAKPQKKSFPLITPTVHSGFSFSIIHLLSAIRVAMITMLPEDSSKAAMKHNKNGTDQGIDEEQNTKQHNPTTDESSSNIDVVPSASVSVPSLTLQEIVTRVRSNPGDPSILETQEPLQDLIRGVLKIFSSRTAPLGAKGWKPLIVFEKPTKRWSWVGPVSRNPSVSEAVEEVTSPDSWGLPHKMLVKLVDSLANWLKNSQDTLKQIGSLPPPPLELMQTNLDEKERFKDLRAQKSLSTIGPSSEEVRAYFRKEELFRYLIPDRTFSYTAVDGKKSIVAPLRRCGGKPTSKARDHFMLKRDRPAHVTILCLVRDAAARLPGSIGTRADVCTLIRDSQYIVDDVSDAQVNQVVSGALDRLHYERDPCVQFDGERKLWMYLHRDREEEDFEDDGTSSTKKWKKQKKDEGSEAGEDNNAVAVQFGASDPNAEDFGGEGDDNNMMSENDRIEENDAETSRGSDRIERNPSTATPLIWSGGGTLHSAEESKVFCQENSANEEFEEEEEDKFDGES